MSLKIPPLFLKEIYRQAERDYPRETCGMLMARREAPDIFSRLRACRNVYDTFHHQDPDNFPRSSRTAFFMDPRELSEIQKEIRVCGETLRVIYHSHIDADCYFSKEDHDMAAPGNAPAYPRTDYLVVSVRRGKAAGSRLFHWNAGQRRYIP